MIDTRTRLLGIISNQMANGNIAANISALSKFAGICRSSIYKYYPDVVKAVKTVALHSTSEQSAVNSTKLDLMRNKYVSQKKTLEYLTNICSNQLIEIIELKQDYDHLKEESSLRINYLESQLALAARSTLKIIK